MPHYHPDTSTLNDYAAGTLDISISIAVKAHLEMCPECRRQVQQLEHAGAYFFENNQSTVSDTLLGKVMNKISNSGIESTQAYKNYQQQSSKAASYTNQGLPKVVQKLLGQPLDKLNWRKLGKKLKFARVKTGDKRNELAMYHIFAGGKVPHHRHKSDEITLVLKGSFSDEDGVYEKGDFILRTVGEQHSIAATQNEDCLCLAVQEKPIAFTGFFRLLNPLLSVEAS